jgi:hypothetical protein
MTGYHTDSPSPDEEFDSATERTNPEDEATPEDCTDDRESLEPHATADCAGADLMKEYGNEEDGGS